MRYFLDTNIFLRFFVEEEHTEREHVDCIALFHGIEEQAVVACTSSLVFAEVAWVLNSLYQYKKDQISRALRSIASSRIRVEEGISMVRAIDLFERYSIKLTDCMIAAHMVFENADTMLLSYDRDFDALGVKRLEPKKALGTLK